MAQQNLPLPGVGVPSDELNDGTHSATGAGQVARGQHLLGTETEYGIVAVAGTAGENEPEPGGEPISPILTSTQAVLAYAETSGQGVNRRTRWDYDNESPLRDIRGFDLRRFRRGAAPVLDPNAIGAANVITANGARFYVDHAHPEYSSPETTSAWDAVIWDKAGDIIMHQAARAAGAIDGQPELKIYKNNVDGKGASYGSHENYLYPRGWKIEDVQQALIPHFVTRQIYTGAGRVGIGVAGATSGFQISQRADYIETDISLETTLNRGIINTRDEPHAEGKRWRRLHVIIGDANMSDTAAYLKLGTTALLLQAIGAGADFSDLRLYEPVPSVQRISRDLSLTEQIRLYGNNEDGSARTLTAIQIQREIRRRIIAALEPSGSLSGVRATDDRKVLDLWEEILDALEEDPLSTADRLDWTAKLALLNGYRDRGLEWSDPRMALVDIQYSDIDPDKGLYHALVKRGRMKTLVPQEAINHAVHCPPRNTRAWLRGQMVGGHSQDVLAANWDSMIVDTPSDGRQATKILMDEPLEFHSREVDGLFPCYSNSASEAASIADVVDGLRAAHPDKVEGIGSYLK